MFSKKTVFVVGAGASKELGLPVGDELKAQIASKLNFAFRDGHDLRSGDVQLYHAVTRHLRSRNERDSNPHWMAGRSIASAMPQAISIDNYLHTHYDDDRIVSMGKLAIAACILEAERRSHIFADEYQNHRHDFATASGVWHNTFCKMLTEGIQKADLRGLFENVSIITFNYDRCIEHYLAIWLENYMRITVEEAQDLVRSLTVIHPYGQVGKLPWQGNSMIPVKYGADIEPHHLFEIASNVRTFTEQMEDETVPDRMKELLTNAEQVVYLGFSFGRMNMELMKLESEGLYKHAYATSLGLSSPNLRIIARQLEEDMHVNGQHFLTAHHFETCTCNELLSNYFRVLTD